MSRPVKVASGGFSEYVRAPRHKPKGQKMHINPGVPLTIEDAVPGYADMNDAENKIITAAWQKMVK
jgi:hypothetical protein